MLQRFTYRKLGKQLCVVGLACFCLGASQVAQADSWQANRPEQIQLTQNQETYQVKAGDTLWAIATKADLSVNQLAAYNQIDLTKGEEKQLRVGQILWLIDKSTKEVQTPLSAPRQSIPSGTGTFEQTSSVQEELTQKAPSRKAIQQVVTSKVENLGYQLISKVDQLLSGQDIPSKTKVEDGKTEQVKPSQNLPQLEQEVDQPKPPVKEEVKPTRQSEQSSLSVKEEPKPTTKPEVAKPKPPQSDSKQETKPSYLYSFFPHTSDGWTKHPGLVLYRGDNPTNLTLWKTLSITGRDPAMMKKGDTYYIAVTGVSVKDKQDFLIYTTKDFETFQKTGLYAGLAGVKGDHVWAPDFFKDKAGQDWVIISASDRGQEPDYQGKLEPSFSPYIMPINLETMTLGQAEKLKLEDKNYIDGDIFIRNDTYNLIIKDEKNKKLELWESQDLTNWSKTYDQIPNTGRWVEGAFVVENPETKDYTIYMDQYTPHDNQEAGMYYTTTSDFETFSERQPLESDQRLRHGNGMVEEIPANPEPEEAALSSLPSEEVAQENTANSSVDQPAQEVEQVEDKPVLEQTNQTTTGE